MAAYAQLRTYFASHATLTFYFPQELRKELEDRGLDSSGLKQALQDRLEAVLTSGANKKAGPAANGMQSALAATAAPAAVASGVSVTQASTDPLNEYLQPERCTSPLCTPFSRVSRSRQSRRCRQCKSSLLLRL